MKEQAITAADQKAFLPEQPQKGHIGFYPCKPGEWRDLPLPLRCSTSYPIDGEYITAVLFDVWFDNYKFSAKVEVHPENVFKALFCLSEGGTQLYKVTGVKWNDGTTSFAKWWHDQRTGAYKISTTCGTTLLVQGGYRGHLPENCKFNEAEGRWTMECNSNGGIKNYSCLC